MNALTPLQRDVLADAAAHRALSGSWTCGPWCAEQVAASGPGSRSWWLAAPEYAALVEAGRLRLLDCAIVPGNAHVDITTVGLEALACQAALDSPEAT